MRLEVVRASVTRPLVLALVLAGASPLAVRAQTAEEPTPTTMGSGSSRPFRGLFSGASVRNDREQSLVVSGSLFVAHVKNVAPEGSFGDVDPRVNLARTYEGANATVQYARRWDHLSIGAYAHGGVAYVPENRDIDREWVNRWSVGGDAAHDRRLGARTRLAMGVGTRYSPFFGFGGSVFGFGSGTISRPQLTPGLDDVLARSPSLQTTAEVSLPHELTPRSSLEPFYTMRRRDYFGEEVLEPSRQEHAAGARFRYRVTRYVGVRVGYSYRMRQYGGTDLGWIGTHELDLGLDGRYGLGRSYALDRHTTFSFTVRPAAFVGERYRVREANEPGEPSVVTSDPRLRLFLGGTADLTRTFGRSWAAQVGYSRTAGYVDGLDRPFQQDRAMASVGGLIGRRLDVAANAAYASGRVGFSGQDRGFSTIVGSAHARMGLTRYLAAYAQYFYYHYLYESGVVLPGGLPPRLDREGVSGGLTFTVPIL